MKKVKISKQFADEFERKCARVNSHGFAHFLNAKQNNTSLIEQLVKIEDTITFKPTRPEKEVELNNEMISKVITEFYSEFLPKKSSEAEQILNQNHPLFIDNEGKSHINFIKNDKLHKNSVGHFGFKNYLDFSVCYNNSINDLRVTAHEISHAVSSRHQHLVNLIRNFEPIEKIDTYTKQDFNRDCIGEIESLIVEKLFNKYLLKKGIYTEKDIQNYKNQEQNSLLNEINLIREENDIISQLPCPVTFDSIKALSKRLQDEKKFKHIERIEKMHNEDKHSSYMFRYVVGRVVSDQWIKKFEQSEENQQKEMLENFQNYLDKTHKLTLNDACEEILNANFNTIVENYVADKKIENNDIKARNKAKIEK